MTKSTPVPVVKKSRSPSRERQPCCVGRKITSYSCKVRFMATVCVILVAAAVALLYFLLSKKTSKQDRLLSSDKQTDWFPRCPSRLLDVLERFDCYPEDRCIDQAACEARGCCYLGLLTPGREDYNDSATDDPKVPTCAYPENLGYTASGKAEVIFNGFEVPLRRLPAPSRYGDDIQFVRMRVEMQTKYQLRIKFYDPEHSRYEVPVPKVPVHNSPQTLEKNAREIFLYSITYNTLSSPFAVKVRRASTDAVVFDMSAGALILSNQFLELTTKLPSFNVYGLGQHLHENYQHYFNWKTFNMFSSQKGIGISPGVHPMYLCIENDGNAHGVLLLNSNAMEVQLHPSQAITFRAIGGVLDFYLFLGPTPEDVIQQYTEAVGRPLIPPYWSLGLQVGKSMYQSTSDIEKFIAGFKTKNIPVETIILSQDILQNSVLKHEEFLEFTNLTSKLQSRNQKFMISFDPSISNIAFMNRDSIYGHGLQNDVFITDKWGLHPIIGQKNDIQVVYPDYGGSTGITWWTGVMKKMSSVLEYDGLWLVNNEPTSDVDGSLSGCLSDNLNKPPYIPRHLGQILYQNTLCMDALLHWRDDVHTHYDYHNFYGHSMVMATEQAFNFRYPMKRKLILSDSTFVGTGQFAGHWIKGLSNDWDGLRSSISAVMEMGLYGVAFSGANVCGDEATQLKEKSKELCLRSLQLGIFFPLLQVYGARADYLYNAQLYGKDFIHAVRNALSRRYELLPYLYTLFYLAHTRGSTIVRPLFHEFSRDNETYSINSQFMWGPALLISPILEEGAKELNFYVPQGTWYDFYKGDPLYSSGEWFTETGGPFDDDKQPAVLHIRAGHIITLQNPSDTTSVSRQNSMSLLVALNASNEARGLLFWDDGETKNSHLLGEYIIVDFLASGSSLVVNGNFGKKVFMSSFYGALIQQVRIMGLSKPPKRIVIDGSYILSNKQYHWNYDTKVLDLRHILIPLGRRTEVQWFF